MRKFSLKNKPVLEYAVLGVVIIAAVFLFLRIRSQDVNFCRSVFSNLVNGRYSAAKHIDWEKFKAMGVDVGAVYLKFPNEKEKTKYKKTLIANLSSSFYKAGGNLRLFVNWRVNSKAADRIVIAADNLKGNMVLLCTLLSEQGKKKLVSLQWVLK